MKKEIPVRGDMRREDDGIVRGKLRCACGCVVHFEAKQESDGKGIVHRLFGLASNSRKEAAQ